MSFPLSFHLGPLGLTGAYWLDDRPNVSCNNSIQRHAVDHQRL